MHLHGLLLDNMLLGLILVIEVNDVVLLLLDHLAGLVDLLNGRVFLLLDLVLVMTDGRQPHAHISDASLLELIAFRL